MRSIITLLSHFFTSQKQSILICPVCESDNATFDALPDYYNDNLKKYDFAYSLDDFETLNYEAYSCSNCGASDRDRLYALYISNYKTQDKSLNEYVLDIAPSVPLENYLKRIDGVSIRTADLMIHGVDDCVDVTDMGCYDNAVFDSFICSHVLEHVPDDKKALSELYRILKPGGWGILMVPVLLTISQIDEDPLLDDVSERWRRFAQDDHVRMYSKHGFLQRVKKAGFKVDQYGEDFFGAEVFNVHGITRKSVLYVVSKPS